MIMTKQEVESSLQFKVLTGVLKRELKGFISCYVNEGDIERYPSILFINLDMDGVEFIAGYGFTPQGWFGPKTPVTKNTIEHYYKWFDDLAQSTFLSTPVIEEERYKADEIEKDIQKILEQVVETPTIPKSHKLKKEGTEYLRQFNLGRVNWKFSFDERKITLWNLIKPN